jgi:hypothetical protein
MRRARLRVTARTYSSFVVHTPRFPAGHGRIAVDMSADSTPFGKQTGAVIDVMEEI